MAGGNLKVGTRLHGGVSAKASVEFASQAEKAGLSSLWFAENPFNRGVLPAMAACAARTERIGLGVGVWNPYSRHPTLIGMEIGALDELAGGRAMLGIGSGIGAAVERMGLSYAKPIAALRDTFTIVRAMLRGETVTYEGTVFSVRDVRLEYPVPRPDMPLYMAATGDQALRLCGAVADGVMISNMSPPGFTRRAVGLMAEGSAKAGREPVSRIVQYMPCVLQSDRAAARQRVKATIGRMLTTYWGFGDRTPAMRTALYRDGDIPSHEFEAAILRLRAGEAAAEVLDDRYVDAYSLAGNGDDCLAGMARFAAVGVTELVVTFVGEDPTAEMARLGEIAGQSH